MAGNKGQSEGKSTSASESRSAVIVGVGAAASDTKSLIEFISAADWLQDAALVIVLQRRETLSEQRFDELKQATAGRLIAIKDKMRPEGGRLYIAPEGMKLTVSGGAFRVKSAKEPAGERGSVDSFLVSLADDVREEAIGVVFAGVGGDGTLGVTAIKEKGGFTLAERSSDEVEAGEHSSQSAAAIADVVAPAEELAQRISSHLSNLGSAVPTKNFDELVAQAAPLLTRIATVLRNRTGHDFHGYKHNTFLRRVQRRMQVTQAGSIESYLDYLRTEPARNRKKPRICSTTS